MWVPGLLAAGCQKGQPLEQHRGRLRESVLPGLLEVGLLCPPGAGEPLGALSCGLPLPPGRAAPRTGDHGPRDLPAVQALARCLGRGGSAHERRCSRHASALSLQHREHAVGALVCGGRSVVRCDGPDAGALGCTFPHDRTVEGDNRHSIARLRVREGRRCFGQGLRR